MIYDESIPTNPNEKIFLDSLLDQYVEHIFYKIRTQHDLEQAYRYPIDDYRTDMIFDLYEELSNCVSELEYIRNVFDMNAFRKG